MRTATEGIAQGAGALMPAPQFMVSKGVYKGSTHTPVYGLPAVRGPNYCSPKLPSLLPWARSPQSKTSYSSNR